MCWSILEPALSLLLLLFPSDFGRRAIKICLAEHVYIGSTGGHTTMHMHMPTNPNVALLAVIDATIRHMFFPNGFIGRFRTSSMMTLRPMLAQDYS